MLKVNSIFDTDLMAMLRNNDEMALTLVYKRYWQPLFISAYNILKDKSACEDIIQEIFIKLWDKREEIEIKISFKAYLFAAVRYEVYRQVKAGNVRDDFFDHVHKLVYQDTHDSLEYKELLTQVNDIINTLPEKCKAVYKLSREEQLSHKEIADRLNISTKTVENHITKAQHRLRTSLSNALILQLIYFFI